MGSDDSVSERVPVSLDAAVTKSDDDSATDRVPVSLLDAVPVAVLALVDVASDPVSDDVAVAARSDDSESLSVPVSDEACAVDPAGKNMSMATSSDAPGDGVRFPERNRPLSQSRNKPVAIGLLLSLNQCD